MIRPLSAAVRSDANAEARRLASRVLLELDLVGVAPTPRTFELWHSHLSGARPALSRQLTALLKQSSPPPAAELDALYVKHLGRDVDERSVSDVAETLRQEARGLAEDIAANSEAVRRYGAVLSECSVEMAGNRSVETLARAVATLTAETARASERNRVLEERLVASTSRVSRLRDTLTEVRREAATDTLTGLYNRGAFDARLRRALSLAKAEGTAVSLLLLDVDHFKRVNDRHGHHVGDLVLRLIGRLLMENLKGRDTAARYGGEEFAVILVGAGLRAGMAVAEQIRDTLRSKEFGKRVPGQGATSVMISIGVAEVRPGDTGLALVARADEALYRAKHAGRDCVCVEVSIEGPSGSA